MIRGPVIENRFEESNILGPSVQIALGVTHFPLSAAWRSHTDYEDAEDDISKYEKEKM